MNERYFQFGRFRVLAEIERGSGEEGASYKAVCEKDGFEGVAVGTMVALKTVKVENEDHRVQLQSYAQELMKLDHPGVERCLGYFVEEDAKDRFSRRGVYVFEWLEGASLKECLRRESNGLDADEVLRIGEKLLSACVYVSTKGVVHRDIKPGNVFICRDGEVKLVDFKIPCTLQILDARSWTENCKYDYEAPEFHYTSLARQGVRLKDGDEQSDLFSVGVCLYEMLMGRLPYMPVDDSHFGANRFARFFARWKDGNDPIVVHPQVNRLLGGAADVLTKALQPQRAERYATFADFAAAFKGVRCRELTHGDNTWRLLRYVGRGGFGEVFKARNVKTGQVVAIKHLQKSQYADWFRREARAMSRLKDSSIVRFVSFFEKEMGGCKQAFLVMEYLDGMPGKTLRDELRAAGGNSLPRDLLIRAFARYAHGLSVLHSKGFVHRDIRPAKLYFPTDAIDRAVIMGLGIGVIEDSSVSETPPVHNLDYLPHEVVDGSSRGDAQMDIYALGLSLYEALSGKMAYSRLPTGTAGLLAFVKRAKEKTRPDLDESSYSDLPDLVRLVREMTEPDVTKRLKDAAEVERRLCILAGFEAVDSIPFDEDADYGPEGFEGRRQNQRKEVVEFVNAMFQKRKRRNLLKNSLLIVAAVAKVFYRWRHPSRGATGTSSEIHDSVTTRMEVSLVTESEDRADVASEILNPDGKTIIDGFHIGRAPLSPAGSRNNVFKAECVEEGRLGLRKGEVVALKFVEETPSSPSFEEFEKAVAYLREIKSPHVPRYYGCFRVERWINGTLKRFRMTVMEYLDGADLGYRVKVRSPMFYADEIMYVLDQLLEGLCELAAAGIVHRDIKPSNVFICRDGTVKLIDFDTALIRGIDLCPKNRKIVGTPEFAAPDYLTEGFRGDEISDVFSVGMTLYYMVHGVSPHRMEGALSRRMDEQTWRDFWAMRQSILGTGGWCVWKQPPNDFRDFKAWISKYGCGDWLSGNARFYVPILGLQCVLRRALAVERMGRFASCLEFRQSLSNIEFARVQCHGSYLRVISDPQATSGVGSGYGCVYGRDEFGCIKAWTYRNHEPLFETDDRGDLLRILIGRLYDPDLPTNWWTIGWMSKGEGKLRLEKSRTRAVPPLVCHEKFESGKVAVLRKSFADVNTLEGWRKAVEHHEFQMQLS